MIVNGEFSRAHLLAVMMMPIISRSARRDTRAAAARHILGYLICIEAVIIARASYDTCLHARQAYDYDAASMAFTRFRA